MIQFAYTILYVADVAKSVSFYEKAFGFAQKFMAEGNQYAELVTGSTTLSLATIDLVKTNLPDGFLQSSTTQKPFGIEIGFTTANVEKTFADAIKAGATEVQPAKTKPWGQVVAYVCDIDGFLIEICTPMA